MDKERILQVLDIAIAIVLLIVGCIAGKVIMTHVADTWFGFNGPAIGVLAIGELAWWRIGNRLIKKWENK